MGLVGRSIWLSLVVTFYVVDRYLEKKERLDMARMLGYHVPNNIFNASLFSSSS